MTNTDDLSKIASESQNASSFGGQTLESRLVDMEVELALLRQRVLVLERVRWRFPVEGNARRPYYPPADWLDRSFMPTGPFLPTYY